MSQTVLDRNDWVKRVLGVDAAAAGTAAAHPADPAAVQQALDAFDAAQETVGQQIGQLQNKLKASEDPDLRRIAEFGLNALTGNTRVKVQAALIELRRRLPRIDPRLAATASRLAEEMADHLVTDDKIRACDSNPFGVRVSIAVTLGGALKHLHVALQSAAG